MASWCRICSLLPPQLSQRMTPVSHRANADATITCNVCFVTRHLVGFTPVKNPLTITNGQTLVEIDRLRRKFFGREFSCRLSIAAVGALRIILGCATQAVDDPLQPEVDGGRGGPSAATGG